MVDDPTGDDPTPPAARVIELAVLNLIQALHETRELTAEHPDHPGWTDLRARIEAILDKLTEDAHDPITEALGAQRLDRTREIATEQAQLAVAALMALHDRQRDEQLELARAAVEDLADSIV